MIGAGRLATQLSRALAGAGHDIVAVYSRTMTSAHQLATAVGAFPTDSISQIPVEADAYIMAVKDDALTTLIPMIVNGREEQCFYHTAGSVPMSVFEGYARHYGVVYPAQTFSKERQLSLARVPFFIEGNDGLSIQNAQCIASSVSSQVSMLDSSQRRYLHLAAVFACNFVNHCYALSADILESHGIPFESILPLIDETAAKVHDMHPRDAQTGPAIRYDESVIHAQEQLLADNPDMQALYTTMSRSIHEKSKKIKE